MKSEDKIRQEIDNVRKDVNNHWNKFLEYEHQGISLQARVHYEDYLRLMGFRDALQWVLKDDTKILKDQHYG